MKPDAKHSNVQGMYPKHGAIFMSSSSTKDECFRLRLFGLPSYQGRFVKQVKTGMVLFLFESEKRELHGVFQASSDGTMNIVPTAWSRSGKKFPAQVRVNPIWLCYPLPESAFGDAIKKNYVSEKRFNLGLSKSQVWRLLMLFSLQKVKSVHPQRPLARYKAIKPVDTMDIDGEVGDGRVSSDNVGNLQKGDKFRSIKRGRYLENLPIKVEKGNPEFGKAENVDVKHGALISTEHTRSVPSVRGDGKLAISGREGSVSHLDVDGLLYSGMPLQETYQVQDQKTSSHQLELPITGHSYEASHDGNDPGLNLPHSQLVGRGVNNDSIQDCDGQNGIVALRNEVNPLCIETNGLDLSIEDLSLDDVNGILSAIDSLPGAASSAELGGNRRNAPFCCPLSPSNYPSFLFDHWQPVAVQNKPVDEITPLTANATSSEEIQCQSPCCSHPADLERADYHEHDCSDHESSDRLLYADRLENRTSVFSRLRFNNTFGWCVQNLCHKEMVNTSSVDEVMAMESGKSCNSNKHADSLEHKGLGSDALEAVEFGGTDACDNTSRERQIKLESFLDFVKSTGDEDGGRITVSDISALDDSILGRMCDDFPETGQITVLESASYSALDDLLNK